MPSEDDAPQIEGADELYGLAAEDFVAARDGLAKRLRGDGDREAAGAVKKLRRPSVPAAAVNHAVRAEPELAEAVVSAGERLGEAQADAIDRGDASGLRDAMRSETDAVEALVETIASAAELGGPMLDRARDTIRAAARSAELREEFLAGRMTRDAEAIGLGGELAQADPPARPGKPKPKPKPAGTATKPKRGASKREAGEPETGPTPAERRKAERAVARAETAAEKAERKAGEATSALEELDDEAARASETAEAARRELAAAEKELERAERDRAKGAERVEAAEVKLAERRDELDAARAALPGG